MRYKIGAKGFFRNFKFIFASTMAAQHNSPIRSLGFQHFISVNHISAAFWRLRWRPDRLSPRFCRSTDQRDCSDPADFRCANSDTLSPPNFHLITPNAVVNNQSAGGGASLSGSADRAKNNCGNRQFQIGIFSHNNGVICHQFRIYFPERRETVFRDGVHPVEPVNEIIGMRSSLSERSPATSWLPIIRLKTPSEYCFPSKHREYCGGRQLLNAHFCSDGFAN